MFQKKDRKSTAEPKRPAYTAAGRHVGTPARPGQPSRVLDYRARRRFPESSSSFRQLQLLLRGSMPLLRQKV